MENIIKLIKAHAYEKAKEAAKQGVKPSIKAQLKLFHMLNTSLLTKEALIIRIIYYHEGFMYDIKHLVDGIERATIESKNWAKITSLIEDAPLQTNNLILLIATIHKHKEEEKVRKILFKYDQLYKLSSISWPESIKTTCQNMIAEIEP